MIYLPPLRMSYIISELSADMKYLTVNLNIGFILKNNKYFLPHNYGYIPVNNLND